MLMSKSVVKNKNNVYNKIIKNNIFRLDNKILKIKRKNQN